MSLTQQALWIIERNSMKPLNLEDVATACGVTHFHLAHAFARRAGLPLVKYLRARRLTIAARQLANRKADILELALESGYASHEAFSRAFKSQFKVTPRAVRAAASTDHLVLVDPLKLSDLSMPLKVSPVRTKASAFVAIGLWSRIRVGDTSTAAGLWQSFMEQAHRLVARDEAPLGISRTTDDADVVDYACAAVINASARPPRGMSRIEVPAREYAVFEHQGHITTIATTYAAIWDVWSAASLPIEEAGLCLERHKPTFNPSTGLGGVEIWVPLQR